MKKLLLAALCFSYISLIAQRNADNAIILKGVSFDSAVQRFRDMGYHIQATDSIMKICITEPSVTSLIMKMKVIKKGKLYITGKYTTNYISSGDHGYIDVLYYKSGPRHPYWVEMMKFAGTFNDIEYGNL
jgi:hypothetical protein